jgi:hypothetical protein
MSFGHFPKGSSTRNVEMGPLGPSFDCLRCFGQHLIVMMWQQHVKIIGVLEEAGDSNPHDVYQELNTYTAAYVYIETYYTDTCMCLYV